MPRTFASGSSQYLEVASTIVTATPFTMMAWYRPTTHTAFNTLVSVGSSTANHSFVLAVNSSGFPYVEATESTSTNATHLTAVVNGTWSNIIGVQTSSTSRDIYHNGLNPVNGAVSKVPTTLTVSNIGCLTSSTRGAFADGDIAHVAFWSVALNTDEIKLLAKGESPLRIRPASLVSYVPIWGQSPETDMQRGTGWTLGAAPATSTNLPPMSQYTNNYRSFSVGDGMSVSEKIR